MKFCGQSFGNFILKFLGVLTGGIGPEWFSSFGLVLDQVPTFGYGLEKSQMGKCAYSSDLQITNF